jgi:hypothetical protein
MALPEYPVVSLAQARDHHLSARKILASGIDPKAGRIESRGASDAAKRAHKQPGNDGGWNTLHCPSALTLMILR